MSEGSTLYAVTKRIFEGFRPDNNKDLVEQICEHVKIVCTPRTIVLGDNSYCIATIISMPEGLPGIAFHRNISMVEEEEAEAMAVSNSPECTILFKNITYLNNLISQLQSLRPIIKR